MLTMDVVVHAVCLVPRTGTAIHTQLLSVLPVLAAAAPC
jgi:hypothetical protein